MLSIKNLYASVEDVTILKGLNLEVGSGEVHAIMGPNGSGKSTLATVLAGREDYEVDESRTEITYLGEDLLEMSIEDRARAGIFLAFQYPVEIPGVNMMTFLKTAVNEMRKARDLDELDAVQFMKLAREKADFVNLPHTLMRRAVNEGFSGGEKKRAEIFQLAMLDPRLAILDETDSGLDIDALRVVADGVNKLRSEDRSFILITHYQRLLEYITPDFVHVLYDGSIVRSGDEELAHELEEKGYDWIAQEHAAITA